MKGITAMAEEGKNREQTKEARKAEAERLRKINARSCATLRKSRYGFKFQGA